MKGPEYPGRVRGCGFGITKKIAFGTSGSSSSSQISYLANIVMNLTQKMSNWENKKEISNVQVQNSEASPIVESTHDNSNPFNGELPSEGKNCYLLLHSPHREVGLGRVFNSPGGVIHNSPLPSGHMKVFVDVVHEAHINDPLPHPIAFEDQIQTVGAAIGYFVAWPLAFLSLVPLEKGKTKAVDSTQGSTTKAPEYPRENDVDDKLCWDFIVFSAENMNDDNIIPISMSSSNFIDEFVDHIAKENILEVTTHSMLSSSCLCLFMRYLCDAYLRDQNKNGRFSFIMPLASPVQFMDKSKEAASQHINRAANEASDHIARAIQRHGGKDHLIMLPYNVGVHWILIAINTANESIYYMDPLLTGHKHVSRNAMRSIINNAIYIYRTNKRQGIASSKALKLITWTDIQCPKQDNGIDCGYYVGLYMEDILVHDQTKISKNYILTPSKVNYSSDNVERFQYRWAGYLWNRFLKPSVRNRSCNEKI